MTRIASREPATQAQNHSNCQTALSTALDLLGRGFWPVAIKPGGKAPIGKEWGVKRPTESSLRATFKENPGAGVGLKLGPDGGIIDIECDGPQGLDSLAQLMGGEIVPTLGWSSFRGPHHVFRYDPRLTGFGKSIIKLPELPGLEIRIGGSGKQFQSNCPPTPGDDGKPREWNGVKTVAELPDAVFSFLEGLARKTPREQRSQANRPRETDLENRVRAYLAKCEPAIGGRNGHSKTFGVACRVGPGFDLTEDQAFRFLVEDYNPKCQPPWSEAEIRHKVEDAYKNESRRGWLLNARPSTNGRAHVPPHQPGIDQKPEPFRQTDLGNGERLVARHGQKLRYCHPWTKWLVWDGKRWKLDDTAAVRRLAKHTARQILYEAVELEDDSECKAMIAWAKTSETKARIDAMLWAASAEEGIPVLPKEMDVNPWILNVANGTLDLQTGRLKPHDPADLITKISPVPFDPDAKCPYWEGTLIKFLVKQDLIDYFQRLCGYALTGSVQEQVLPIAYGTGANGKSTILDAILNVLGEDYAVKLPSAMLMTKKSESHPTELTLLHGKRFCAAIETEEGKRLSEVLIKELTGGDQITGRRMREDFWSFSPTHKIFLATNHKPEIRGTDHAIWRRPKLIPFEVKVEGRAADQRMPAKLRAEYTGILAWCVRGCLDWLEGGLREPESVTQATSEFRSESDVLQGFLDEMTVVLDGTRERCGKVYQAYAEWAEKANLDRMNQTRFGYAMRERGIGSEGTSQKYYSGLRLRE